MPRMTPPIAIKCCFCVWWRSTAVTPPVSGVRARSHRTSFVPAKAANVARHIQNAWLRLGGWMDAVALHEVQVPGHAVQQKGNQRKRVLLGECGVDLRKLVRIAAPVTRRDLHAHQYRLSARSSTQLDHLAEVVLQCAKRLPAQTIVATQL